MVFSEKNGKALTLSFDGKIDRETEDVLQRIVTWDLEGVEEVCVDMENLDDLYGSLIRILEYAQRSLARNGSFTTKNANPRVAEVCRAHGLGVLEE